MSTFKSSTKINKFIITTPVIRVFQIYFFISLILSDLFCTCKSLSGGSRIINGSDASIEYYPYQVSLEIEQIGHVCGGSILSNRYILTAAHCLAHDIRYYSIRAGSTYHKEGGMHIKVEKKFLHPKYNADTVDFDVAIVHLAKPLKFSKKIRKIKLPDNHNKYKAGIKAVVTGWGFAENDTFPERLQCLCVPIIDQQECIKYYKNYRLSITKQMFCAGYPEGKMDSCSGDSGGPLVVQGVQLGIVSWGEDCALPNYPGVYTNVAIIRKFITDITGI